MLIVQAKKRLNVHSEVYFLLIAPFLFEPVQNNFLKLLLHEHLTYNNRLGPDLIFYPSVRDIHDIGEY